AKGGAAADRAVSWTATECVAGIQAVRSIVINRCRSVYSVAVGINGGVKAARTRCTVAGLDRRHAAVSQRRSNCSVGCSGIQEPYIPDMVRVEGQHEASADVTDVVGGENAFSNLALDSKVELIG